MPSSGPPGGRGPQFENHCVRLSHNPSATNTAYNHEDSLGLFYYGTFLCAGQAGSLDQPVLTNGSLICRGHAEIRGQTDSEKRGGAGIQMSMLILIPLWGSPR